MTIIWVRWEDSDNNVYKTFDVNITPRVGEMMDLGNGEYVVVKRVIHHPRPNDPMTSGIDIIISRKPD
ncbi:MAG: hypothetical protein ACR2LL_08715 [Nitrosopumilus sp.]